LPRHKTPSYFFVRGFGRYGLSELLSSLIVLAVAVAASLLVIQLYPVLSPSEPLTGDRLRVVVAFGGSGWSVHLYNPSNQPITVTEVWGGGVRASSFTLSPDPIPPGGRGVLTASFPTAPQSILLRLSTGAWMEVRADA